MKKYLLLLLLAYSSLFSQTAFENETDLFLNSDESANAFRYNPAILGLGHKFNANLNLYYYPDIKGIREYDIQLAFGHFALAYDFLKSESTDVFNKIQTKEKKLSLGLGFGNKKISGGVAVDFNSYRTNYSEWGVGDITVTSNNSRFSFAATYRVSDFISLSGVFRTFFYYDEKMAFKYPSVTAGFGVRPFRNNKLELFADAWYNINKYSKLKDVDYKFGASVRVIEGLKLNFYYGSYYNYLSSESFPYKYFGAGITLDLGHLAIKTNAQYKKSNSSSYSKYSGSNISLSYSSEFKGNIIPERNKNLDVNISGTLQDYYTSPVLFGLLGGEKNSIHSLIKLLDDASENRSVKGLYLHINPIVAGRTGLTASLEELGNAIERFKKKNKKIVAYLAQGGSIEEYYIASFANQIVMPREANIDGGLYIDVVNYKGFLAKFGIDLETIFAGKYKLTFQGFLDSSTAEGKEVINRMLDVVYEKFLNRIKTGRNVEITDLLKEQLSGLLNPYELKNLKLIDEIGWEVDARLLLGKLTGVANISKHIRTTEWDDSWQNVPVIAVIGIYGGITSGESSPPSLIQIPLPIPYLNSGRTTGSQTILRQLEKAFADDNIKAVILRVNSGGGSALASAEIFDAIKRLKEKYKKPFIVSMGDAAASGGYYVSANSDFIFADELTVTGSIGVFSALSKLDSLAKLLNIKVETFSRGKLSGLSSPYSEMSKEQKDNIQKEIDYIYDEFIKSVMEGRNLTREQAESVAQGRVWLGIDAFNLKLVDKIGGFVDAYNYAIKMSGIENKSNIHLVFYPVAGSDESGLNITKSVLEFYFEEIINFLGF